MQDDATKANSVTGSSIKKLLLEASSDSVGNDPVLQIEPSPLRPGASIEPVPAAATACQLANSKACSEKVCIPMSGSHAPELPSSPPPAWWSDAVEVGIRSDALQGDKMMDADIRKVACEVFERPGWGVMKGIKRQAFVDRLLAHMQKRKTDLEGPEQASSYHTSVSGEKAGSHHVMLPVSSDEQKDDQMSAAQKADENSGRSSALQTQPPAAPFRLDDHVTDNCLMARQTSFPQLQLPVHSTLVQRESGMEEGEMDDVALIELPIQCNPLLGRQSTGIAADSAPPVSSNKHSSDKQPEREVTSNRGLINSLRQLAIPQADHGHVDLAAAVTAERADGSALDPLNGLVREDCSGGFVPHELLKNPPSSAVPKRRAEDVPLSQSCPKLRRAAGAQISHKRRRKESETEMHLKELDLEIEEFRNKLSSDCCLCSQCVQVVSCVDVDQWPQLLGTLLKQMPKWEVKSDTVAGLRARRKLAVDDCGRKHSDIEPVQEHEGGFEACSAQQVHVPVEWTDWFNFPDSTHKFQHWSTSLKLKRATKAELKLFEMVEIPKRCRLLPAELPVTVLNQKPARSSPYSPRSKRKASTVGDCLGAVKAAEKVSAGKNARSAAQHAEGPQEVLQSVTECQQASEVVDATDAAARHYFIQCQQSGACSKRNKHRGICNHKSTDEACTKDTENAVATANGLRHPDLVAEVTRRQMTLKMLLESMPEFGSMLNARSWMSGGGPKSCALSENRVSELDAVTASWLSKQRRKPKKRRGRPALTGAPTQEEDQKAYNAALDTEKKEMRHADAKLEAMAQKGEKARLSSAAAGHIKCSVTGEGGECAEAAEKNKLCCKNRKWLKAPQIEELQQLLAFETQQWSPNGTQVFSLPYAYRLVAPSVLSGGDQVVRVLDVRATVRNGEKEFYVSTDRPGWHPMWLLQSYVPDVLIADFRTKVELPKEWHREEDAADMTDEYKVQQQMLNNWSKIDAIDKAGSEQWALLDDFVIFEDESRSPASLTRSYCGGYVVPSAKHVRHFATLSAAGRVTASDGTVLMTKLDEIKDWGVKLQMPNEDDTDELNEPIIWIETRFMRYRLGAPAECYAGIFQALGMEVHTAQVCLSYMFWNPSAEPDFAMRELCKGQTKYNNKAKHRFDEKFFKDHCGFCVWALDSQKHSVDNPTANCTLMRQIRAEVGSMKSMSKASRRGKKEVSDDDIAARQCLVCGRKDDEDDMLLCDGCDRGFHSQCMQISPEDLKKLVRGSMDWHCVACKQEKMKQPLKCCSHTSFLKATVLEGLRPTVEWLEMPKNCMAGLDDNQYGELTLHGTCQVLCLLRHHFGIQLGRGSLFVDLGSGLGQIALRVALLTGADVCGIESSVYCTEFAAKWRDTALSEHLFNDFHCDAQNDSKIEFLAEDFLKDELRDYYERASCILINNFVFTHQTNAALSERISRWCAIDTTVVVAKDLPKPLTLTPNDLEFLGVYQLPCGSADWTDNSVLSMSVYRVVKGATDIKRRRSDRPKSWSCPQY